MIPSEIRIGNRVKIKDEPAEKEFTVSLIDKFSFCCEETEEACYDMVFAVPIILTTEYLLKKGFYNTAKPHIFHKTVVLDEKTEYEFKVIVRNKKICFDFIMGSVSLSKELTYLHEMQNIFFTLTDKEL